MPPYDVIQICQTVDGLTPVNCRLIAASALTGTPTLSQMMPVIGAIVGLMALAWIFKQVLQFIQKG